MATGLVRFSLLQWKAAPIAEVVALTPRALKHLHSFPGPQDTPSSDHGDHSSGTHIDRGPSTSVPSSSDRTSRTAFPLCDELPRQFLTSDGETIVCVHPSSTVDISNTRPLHPHKPKMDLLRTKLNPEEAEYVQKLRFEDPDVWSVGTLARLFNVRRTAISKAAPADDSRLEQVEEEQKLVLGMKPYRRKLHVLEREAKRQKRLQQALAQSNYQFPNNK